MQTHPNDATDPMTGTALRTGQLKPNKCLRDLVLTYLQDHPWAWGQLA